MQAYLSRVLGAKNKSLITLNNVFNLLNLSHLKSPNKALASLSSGATTLGIMTVSMDKL